MRTNWLLTASRDRTLKLFDLRHLAHELQTFKGHKKEVFCARPNSEPPPLATQYSYSYTHTHTSQDYVRRTQSIAPIGLAWHPNHESLFASGGADGALYYWLVG